MCSNVSAGSPAAAMLAARRSTSARNRSGHAGSAGTTRTMPRCRPMERSLLISPRAAVHSGGARSALAVRRASAAPRRPPRALPRRLPGLGPVLLRRAGCPTRGARRRSPRCPPRRRSHRSHRGAPAIRGSVSVRRLLPPANAPRRRRRSHRAPKLRRHPRSFRARR